MGAHGQNQWTTMRGPMGVHGQTQWIIMEGPTGAHGQNQWTILGAPMGKPVVVERDASTTNLRETCASPGSRQLFRGKLVGVFGGAQDTPGPWGAAGFFGVQLVARRNLWAAGCCGNRFHHVRDCVLCAMFRWPCFHDGLHARYGC